MLKKQLIFGFLITFSTLISEAQTIFQAALSGNIKQIEKLLSKGQNIDSTSGGGLSALHFAVKGNQYKAAEYLLSKGASVDPFSDEGRTPLMYALAQKKIEMMKLLIANGADVNLRDYNSQTPMMVALSYQHSFAIIELLYNSGADIFMVEETGYDCTDLTERHKDKKKIDELFSTPAEIELE